jgi:hypothetical protein
MRVVSARMIAHQKARFGWKTKGSALDGRLELGRLPKSVAALGTADGAIMAGEIETQKVVASVSRPGGALIYIPFTKNSHGAHILFTREVQSSS